MSMSSISTIKVTLIPRLCAEKSLNLFFKAERWKNSDLIRCFNGFPFHSWIFLNWRIFNKQVPWNKKESINTNKNSKRRRKKYPPALGMLFGYFNFIRNLVLSFIAATFSLNKRHSLENWNHRIARLFHSHQKSPCSACISEDNHGDKQIKWKLCLVKY